MTTKIKDYILENVAIGQYRFANGQTVPAATILQGEGMNYPPSGTTVKGYELVFYPEIIVEPLLGNNYIQIMRITLYVKNWSALNLQSKLGEILSLDLNIVKIVQVPKNEENGIPEMAVITMEFIYCE